MNSNACFLVVALARRSRPFAPSRALPIFLSIIPFALAFLADGARAQDPPPFAAIVSQLASEEPSEFARGADRLERASAESGRPGADGARREFVKSALAALEAELPLRARVALIEEIGRLGKYESVRPLASILGGHGEAAVREAARRALERIPVVTVKKALRDALSGATGNLRLGVLRAMGLRKDALAVQHLLEAARDEDREVRLVAIESLALIGEISSVSVLEEALRTTEGIDHLRVRRAYLRLADSLVANSERGTARRIYDRATSLGIAEHCAALIGFARAGLQSEIARIAAATGDANRQIRGAALEAAVLLPGPRMTAALVARSREAKDADERRRILWVLARRGDDPAIARLLELAGASESDDEVAYVVRLLGGIEPRTKGVDRADVVALFRAESARGGARAAAAARALALLRPKD